MAVRLLFTFADNEGHLLSMRYLVLSPFPPSNGDHHPATATMLTRLGQRRTSSNSIRNLDSLPPHRYWISSPAGQPTTERRRPRLCQVGAASTRARRPIPLRERRPTPRTRPIAPHSAEEAVPLTGEGHTMLSRLATPQPESLWSEVAAIVAERFAVSTAMFAGALLASRRLAN
jgi:hypothetical protein